jgi:hypothetical protein
MSVSLFHPEQIKAGDEIVQAFTRSGKNYAILWALCQSGKSGTFHWVAKRMLVLGHVSRVYLLCGSAEVCLREQAEADAKHYNGSPVKDGSFQVVFRTGFKKLLKEGGMNIENALIIIDESHLDQTKGMELDQFLSAHGLNLTGDCPEAVKQRCRILSVSATPYAEIAALKDCERLGRPVEKAIVHLAPGKGYVGIRQFLDEGKIKATFDISESTTEAFAAFLKKKDFACRYNIMRVKTRRAAKVIRQVCARLGFHCASYTAKNTSLAITEEERDTRVSEAVEKSWRSLPASKRTSERKKALREKASLDHPWLGEAPVKTTIILIKDRLRAGKVVPKEHIGFVWEDAASSNTDTLVQALLGRMCGYYKAGQYHPRIYLPGDVIARHEGCVIEQSELERAIAFNVLPRHFSHSMPSRLNKVTQTQCVPILLKHGFQKPENQWTKKYTNSASSSKENMKTRELCFKALQHLFATDSAQFAKFTSGQKLAVASILKKGVADIKMRYMASKINEKGQIIMSQPDWFEKMAEGQKMGTSMHGIHEIWNSKASAKEHPDLTFAVVYDGYTVPGAVPGDVYAIFYTDQPGTLEALSHKLRYSMTDEKEIYSGPGEEYKPSIFSPVLPAGTFGLPRACFSDPDLFRSELRKILVSGLHIRELEPPECGTFAFNPDAYSYKGRTDNELERVCASLGAELGKSIRIRYKPAPVVKNFHVTNISWSSCTSVSEDPC